MEPHNNNLEKHSMQNATSSDDVSVQLPSVFSLYPQSWRALKIAFVPLVMLALRPILALLPLFLIVMIGVMSTAGAGPDLLRNSNMLVNIISGIIGAVSFAIFIYYLLRIAPANVHVQLAAVRGQKVQHKDALRATKHMMLPFFLLSLMTGVIILVGFLLFIVPGLFMLKRYILAGYHMVDDDLRSGEAMDRAADYSTKYSNGHWGLVGLQAVMIIVSYLPLVGVILSLILTIAYYNVNAVRYEQIKCLAKPNN